VKVLGPNDKIISGLAAASTLDGTELVPVVQGGVTEKATVSQLGAFANRSLHNCSISTPGAGFAADTYLIGSEFTIPAGGVQAKTFYRCLFSVAKTGAGTAAPVLTLRMGTLGTISDAAILAFTFPLQTAVVDEGVFSVDANFRAVGIGTTAVVAGIARLTHDNGSAGTSAGTGLSVQAGPAVPVVSSGFNSTTVTKIGLSVNGGTSAAWTIAVVQSSLINIP
jgi:hypothetical protein